MLQFFLQNKKSQESIKLLNDLGIKTDIYKDVYVVYPELQNLDTKLLNQCNHTIIDKNTNKIVHYFSEIELNTENQEEIIEKYNKYTDYIMARRFEGSLIRVYNLNGVWVVGTNKKPDASYVFWSSDKSFKQLFYECIIECYNNTSLDEFFDTLDKNFCYSYIIQHPENNLCIKSEQKVVYFINKVNLTNMDEILNESLIVENTFTDVLEDLDISGVTDNYIMYLYNKSTPNNYSRIILDSDKFRELKNLYGNSIDISIRYLKVYKDEEMKKNLRIFFTEHTEKFDLIEQLLYSCVMSYMEIYKNMYILKIQLNLHPFTKRIMYKLHGIYLSRIKDYNVNKKYVDINDLINVLLDIMSPKKLLKFIGYT